MPLTRYKLAGCRDQHTPHRPAVTYSGAETPHHEGAVLTITNLRVSPHTRRTLGRTALAELSDNLHPGHCLTCDQPLGTDPTALVIYQLEKILFAHLHHPRCRKPSWIHPSTLASLRDHDAWAPTTRSFSVLVEPELAGRNPRYLPVVVVNPTLELVTLEHDPLQGRWAVATVAHYGTHGFAALQGLLVRSNLPDLTDLQLQLHLPDDGTDPSLVVQFGDFPPWTLPLMHAVATQAQQQGGLALIVTSALDPRHLTAGFFESDDFVNLLRSGKAGAGWLPIPDTAG